MTKRIWSPAAALGLLCSWSSLAAAQGVGGAGPPDPPKGYNQPAGEISGPSVVTGQKAGIEVGQYAPDFKLEPIQPYPALRKWLGDKAPKSAAETVPLAQLVGKVPVMLLFGSYT
jgi:hypothetical protein